MLTPLSLCGDQGHSLLLRMTSGRPLCALQAKRSVFNSLDVSRFDPAGAHPEEIVFFASVRVSAKKIIQGVLQTLVELEAFYQQPIRRVRRIPDSVPSL